MSRLKKKIVTLEPFLLFYFLQKRLTRCVGSVFVTRSKKHTVADVGHSNNKAVKKNGKKCQRVLQSVSDDGGNPYVRHCKFVGLVTRTELGNVYMCTWKNFSYWKLLSVIICMGIRLSWLDIYHFWTTQSRRLPRRCPGIGIEKHVIALKILSFYVTKKVTLNQLNGI